MHPDQVDLPLPVVARLVAARFPSWRDRPVRAVASTGTVNALFRVGADVVLRFPLRPRLDPAHRSALLREQEVARCLAPHLPVAVPEPLGIGAPGEGYPGPWAAFRWIPGEAVDPERVPDPVGLARDLAAVIGALQDVDVGGRDWNGRSRGGPLSLRDAGVRQALSAGAGLVDASAVARVWERCLRAPEHRGPPVCLHADLMPGNLLVRQGRLAAIIDLADVCVGDPAVDLMPAWNLLPSSGRSAFRAALDVDDAAWDRGRGWALVQAIEALPYYVSTNPAMAATARHTLSALLEDAD